MSTLQESTQSTAAAAGPINRLPFRFRWSHRGKLHRILVKIYNSCAKACPFGIKYGIGKARRKNWYPYKLIKPGSTVVQIGAPRDTLLAGRSRGMYFSLFNGPKGKTVVIEPAKESETAFNRFKERHGLEDLIFLRSGAWNERKNLKLYVDPSHPATNFTEGTVDYEPDRLAQFDVIEIPCNTVDDLLGQVDIEQVDLLSMTTNGAEIEILQGMSNTLKRGVRYICLARHLHLGDLAQVMESYGYEEFAYDDRGVTYRLKDHKQG